MNKRRQGPELFRAIAEFTYDWESWIDSRGRLAWVNAAVERMTGYTADECMRLPRYPLSIVHEEDRKRIRAALAGARRGSSGNDVEFRVVQRNGAIRWLAISWQPLVYEGARYGYRTSVRDIDDRKRAEQAVHEAKLRAEEANRAKSEFLAVMSHEIRSPMQVVSGYAQLLALTRLDTKQRTYVERIARENAALLRIVDDVLEFSSLQSGAVSLQKLAFDYRAIVRSVVDAVRPRARSKQIRLRLSMARSLPEGVFGDPDRVRQVLLNVVDNAVKFTAKGEVSLTVTARVTGDVVTVTTRVRDTGIGISRARLGRLFRMFSQADSSTSRRYGGSGLGLAICRRLCEAMGGSIDVDSVRGEGSTFTIRLPFCVGKMGRSPAPIATVSADHDLAKTLPRRILVVDDSAVARDVTCRLLATLGYTADSASSGRRALEIIRRTRYDIVFLDMHMPGLDGLETARAIRSSSGGGRPLLVALTADVFVRGAERGVIDAVLTKPVIVPKLTALLSRLPAARLATSTDASVLEDLKRATDASGRSLLLGLAPKVRAEGEAMIAEMIAARDAKDAKRLNEALHRLKGLALSFGARELAMQTTTMWTNAAGVGLEPILPATRGRKRLDRSGCEGRLPTDGDLAVLSTLFEQAMRGLERSTA